jgi:hypothetical protein
MVAPLTISMQEFLRTLLLHARQASIGIERRAS